MPLLKTLFSLCLLFIGYLCQAQWYDWQTRVTLSDSELIEFSKVMDDNGYMPANICGFYYNGEVRFSTIWEKYPQPSKWEFKVNMSYEELNIKMGEMNNLGFSPVDLSTYSSNNQVRYACIWAQAYETLWQAWSDLDPQEFQARNDTLIGYNFTLTDINGYELNGKPYYSGIWKKYSSGPWKYTYGHTEDEFKGSLIQLKEEGYVLYDMSVFILNGQTRYNAIWMQNPQEVFFVAFSHELGNFQAMLDKQIEAGFALTDFDGYTLDGMTYYSAIFKKVVAAK